VGEWTRGEGENKWTSGMVDWWERKGRGRG
jgi:hypothetical protein